VKIGQKAEHATRADLLTLLTQRQRRWATAKKESMMLEKRAIAFIDILGFKDVVKRMRSDLGLVNSVHQILQDILQQEQAVYENLPRILLKESLEMTSFSDCVVISDLQQNFDSVMASARSLYLDLLRHGILSRGAITIGTVFHKGRIVFGEGLVSAYTLESSAAVYPRIIVPDDFRIQLEQEDTLHFSSYKFANTLAQDSDGLWFIQPFGYPRAVPAQSDGKNTNCLYMNQFRKHIETGMRRFEKEHNIPVLAKYRWLARRFNEAIEAEDITVPLLTFD
jgi:hypothetical protein